VAAARRLRRAAQGKSGRKILVAIFQRGAADGLNIVVPFFEPAVLPASAEHRYRAAGQAERRSRSRWPVCAASGSAAAEGDVGQPPAGDCPFGRFSRPVTVALRRAGVHGVRNARHQEGRRLVESALAPVAPDSSPVRAIASGAQLPKTLQGSRGAIAVDSLPRFQVADKATAELLEHLYLASPDAQLKAQGQATFDAVKLIESIRSRPYTPPPARSTSANSASGCSRSRA
jgi:hypothetical protein